MNYILAMIVHRYPLSLAIALVIWIVCMIPVPETPLSEISFIDKWTHFVMYAVLTLCILWEHQKAGRKSSLWIVLIPVTMGCLVELAQAYLTTCRSGDWFDALCNALGSLLGFGIFTLAMKLKALK